jgi:succinoglycan biosynthesis transport protein ExoP
MNNTDDIVQTGDAAHELMRFVAACRRQLWVVIVSMLVAALIGYAIISSLPRLYTASAFVLIDNSRRVRAVENNYDVNSGAVDYVESQVEVVKSGRVAEIVIKKMKLLEKPLQVSTPSILSLITKQVYALVGLSDTGGPSEAKAEKKPERLLEDTIGLVRSGLEVQHLARTMVLQISYTASSSAIAAEMANAYADAYIADELNAKYEETRRASSWLEERLAELKQISQDATLAVQKFRIQNNLISSNSKQVNEQQITELNTQVVNARKDRERADAHYERLKTIIESHDIQAVFKDAFGSNIIEHLRTKYSEAAKKDAREEVREYERQIFSELSRMEEAFQSEVNIAQAKEAALSGSLENLVAAAGGENKRLVTLRNLENEAESSRKLYETYLQRYQEALQQQSFPIVEARTITPAYEPSSPSLPKKTVLMLLFLSLGGFAGACIGIFREFRERGFQSQEQIKAELGVESLGIAPLIKGALDDGGARPIKGLPQNEKPASPVSRQNKLPEHGRVTSLSNKAWNYALINPNSALGEALLAAKLAADIRCSEEPCKIIGVMSALPGEGKTLFSKNFGSLLAALGARVLLIDGDLRKMGLSHGLAPRATKGLLEVITAKHNIADILYSEPGTGLNFLPTVSRHQITHSSDVLASPSMRKLLTEMRSQFDYIVIDLPPLGPVVDTRAIASQVDAFILVIEWRRTPRRIVSNLLREDARVSQKCMGAVLNKVDLNKIKLFEEYGSRLYQYEMYLKSYRVDK